MPASKSRIRPGVERLDDRVVLSAAVSTAATSLVASLRPVPGSHPSANPDRPFTPADLQLYAQVYLSTAGEPDFTPQYDFNGTGFIGQPDATPILRGLAAITPKVPLKLSLRLATGEQVHGHHPAESGGVTRLATVTVIGQTTPNSIVFIDGPTTSIHAQSTGNFKFQGGALATDSRGEFDYTVKLPDVSRGGSLLSVNFLIRTPFNQQLIRSFPILRIR
jgi:hypothetical protein